METFKPKSLSQNVALHWKIQGSIFGWRERMACPLAFFFFFCLSVRSAAVSPGICNCGGMTGYTMKGIKCWDYL